MVFGAGPALHRTRWPNQYVETEAGAESLTRLPLDLMLLEARAARAASSEPPSLWYPKAIHQNVGADRTVLEPVGVGHQVGGEGRHHYAPFVVADALHLHVDLPALRIVEHGTGFHQQLVEALVLPVRFVPGRAVRISDREHHVLGRTADPEAHHERRLEPDIIPVAVLRLRIHRDVDARLGGVLLVQDCRIHRSGEGGIRRVQRDLELGIAGLLEVELGLFGVIQALGDLVVGGMKAVRAAYRVIVAEHPGAAQDGVQQRLAVDGVFEGQPHIVVVDR